jgi:hypothetical protein
MAAGLYGIEYLHRAAAASPIAPMSLSRKYSDR